jgi:putative PIN family toxin of toxin-antitoxin system
MLLTVDTNVLFMGLYSSKGASFRILEFIRQGHVQLALSVPVFTEYQDVLRRPSSLKTLELSTQDVENFLDGLSLLAFPFDIHYLMRPNLQDENDNMFVDLAFASSSDFLVTANIRDFSKGNQLKFDGFKVVTPKELVSAWEDKQ